MDRWRVVSGVVLLLAAPVLACGGGGSSSDSSHAYSERSDRGFAVSDASLLEVTNFAGEVNVLQGGPGEVVVVAEKWAGRAEDLGQIEVEMVALQNGVSISTSTLPGLKQVSVDLDVTAPPDARPIVAVAAGDISYEGRGEGECRFTTAAGTVTLRLPADVNAEVYLSVGAGTMRVDFPVTGQVGDHLVDGIIGTGADGRIEVRVAAGQITVRRQ